MRLKPELGDIPLPRLTSRDVSGMEDRLLMRGVGLSVLRYARQVLTCILNYALKSGLITRSPITGLVLQLQKCGEEFQAASVMAAPGRCLVPPSPPGPPQH